MRVLLAVCFTVLPIASRLFAGAPEVLPRAPEAAVEPDDKFEAARLAFLRAGSSNDAKERQTALDALVALARPEVLAPLLTEYARVADDLRTTRAKQREQASLVERRKLLLEQLRKRAERDADLKPLIERDAEELKKIEKELARIDERITDGEPWRVAIRDGVAKLMTSLSTEKRKKAEGELSKDAEEHPEPIVRAASIDLLGDVGSPGTAVLLQRIVAARSEQVTKLEAGLPKMMADVRKMEKRLQEEATTQGERFSNATLDQYQAVKKEAAAARTHIYELTAEADLAANAGGRALGRMAGKDLDGDLAAILRALKKAKDRSRTNTIAMLGQARNEATRAALRATLAAETEPLARAQVIDALAAQMDAQAAQAIIEKHLLDTSWIVRSHSAAALATLRSREAIPALIARLDAEEGRVRTDVSQALVSLTGQNFRTNSVLWKRWWTDAEKGFTVAPAPPHKSAEQEARESEGVTFFGITTESQSILFVLDCSLSMNFSLIAKNNPDDDPSKPFDMPGADEPSRFAVAKSDLLKAIGGLRDGGVFNLVLYAADVWTWDDQLVTMSSEARKDVNEYVQKLEPGPGTNIYGALDRALELAGAKGGGTWSKPAIDTMYFLTDGRATIGLSTDTEEILAMVRDKNSSAGIVIHTIGLSGAQDAVLLRRLAEENGGIYVAR